MKPQYIPYTIKLLIVYMSFIRYLVLTIRTYIFNRYYHDPPVQIAIIYYIDQSLEKKADLFYDRNHFFPKNIKNEKNYDVFSL